MMPSFRENHGVKLSVEETSPSPGVVQPWSVNEDEDQNGITNCSKYMYRCVGAVTCGLRSLTAVVTRCRVFRSCGRHEAVDCDEKLSVEETSPSQVSVQPWGVVEDGDMPYLTDPSISMGKYTGRLISEYAINSLPKRRTNLKMS